MKTDDIQSRLAENVRRLRRERQLTQFQLAEKAGVSEETVKNIELSRCWTSDRNLSKITDALGVDVCCLFLPSAQSLDERSEVAKTLREAAAESIRCYIDGVVSEIAGNPPYASIIQKKTPATASRKRS